MDFQQGQKVRFNKNLSSSTLRSLEIASANVNNFLNTDLIFQKYIPAVGATKYDCNIFVPKMSHGWNTRSECLVAVEREGHPYTKMFK